MGIALFTCLLWVVVAWFWQTRILASFGTPRMIGDEGEYVKRGQKRDPLEPDPFLRVPIMPLLARLALAKQSPPNRLRLLQRGLSALTIGAVAFGGYLIAGYIGLWVAAAIFILLPERMLLAQHLWPDVPLATILAAWSMGALLPPSEPTFWLLGCLNALAFLTRVDALAITPTSLLAVLLIFPEQFHAALLPLIAPCLLSGLLLSLRNGETYGLWLPDNTAFFNLTLMHKETAEQEKTYTTTRVKAVKKDWDAASHQTRMAQGILAVSGIVKRPLRTLLGIWQRFLGLCGKETFISQKLLHPTRGAYPQARPEQFKSWNYLLRFAFPLLLAATIAALVQHQGIPFFLTATLALFFVSFLFHTRTRYRLALLPGMVLAAVWLIQHSATSDLKTNAIAMIAGLAIFLLTSVLNHRQEQAI